MKRIIKLSLLLLALLLPATAHASYDFAGDGERYWYNFKVDGIYYIIEDPSFHYVHVTDADGKWQTPDYSDNVIIIPDSFTYQYVNGDSVTYTVTGIFAAAFEYCSALTTVTIPNSVTEIKDYAFKGCSALTSLDIGNSVRYFGGAAFEDCSALTSVTIPNSVTAIGSWAFRGCTSLTSVTIPNSVTYIGTDAFYGCSALTNLDIGNSVTEIRNYAFCGCTTLATVKCRGTVPPTMENGYGFDPETYKYATLLVPRNCEAIYAAADGWCNFYHIQSYEDDVAGDVDGDGVVNISDLSALIDLLLMGDESNAGADVDGDGEVTIADVSALIDKLLAGS